MRAVEAATVPVVDSRGSTSSGLNIRLLPGNQVGQQWPLVDCREDTQRTDGSADIQLLEDGEYLYEFEGIESGAIETDRADVLYPDTKEGNRGRVRPGSRVGTLPITVLAQGKEIGTATVEIRSRKLGYDTEYQWMLRDIADVASELMMERFAPMQRRFRPYEMLDARTAYERFTFLRSLLLDAQFQAALAVIFGRPHHGWIEEPEWKAPSAGLSPGSATAAQLLKPGQRVRWDRSFIPALSSLPAKIQVDRADETVDTPPNR